MLPCWQSVIQENERSMLQLCWPLHLWQLNEMRASLSALTEGQIMAHNLATVRSGIGPGQLHDFTCLADDVMLKSCTHALYTAAYERTHIFRCFNKVPYERRAFTLKQLRWRHGIMLKQGHVSASTMTAMHPPVVRPSHLQHPVCSQAQHCEGMPTDLHMWPLPMPRTQLQNAIPVTCKTDLEEHSNKCSL